ncbi:hypothetical protein K6Y31_16490 [Motilimonas cestriensis]|uniref:Lipoprotein n=1 Tax=Motilimonas cestriensis TaxID=2742685 RepID=A0ABS8WFH1_9GAMM|nr:hypothetical protein [Motilimonas cestriensis]MCE2596396.1 hypothetical protein [Motilimonas cestriensis]
MLKKSIALALASLSLLGGCSTPYQESGIMSQGIVKPINKEITLIRFYTNQHTPVQHASKFAMFRSAKFASENNKPYFYCFKSLTDAANNQPSPNAAIDISPLSTSGACYVQLLDSYKNGSIETNKAIQERDEFMEGENHEN